MPGSPEIWNLTDKMDETLKEKRITGLKVKQAKCLNIPQEEPEKLVIDEETQRPVLWEWVLVKLHPAIISFLTSMSVGSPLFLEGKRSSGRKILAENGLS